METMFGGRNGEQENALMTALINAAEGEGSIYKFLDETPKTSLVVELVQELHKLGYQISKRPTRPQDGIYIIGHMDHGTTAAVAHEFEKRGLPSVVLDPELEAAFSHPMKKIKIELPQLSTVFTAPPTRAERRAAKRKKN